jgi:copper homeostasis protein
MRKIIFELCAESIQACLAAREGGADRIELCTALSEGGLTPSHGLTRAAVLRSGLPVHVLLRPRGGDFLYTEDEFVLMREDLLHARTLGASGFVLGILCADGTVDIERTRELVDLAAPLEITFHRAFDYTVSLDQALEDVIATGCKRVLTSGGERDVLAGADRLARLVELAAGRIEIAAGGGLRIKDAAALARATRASHFHGSLRRSEASRMQHESQWVLEDADQFDGASRFVVDADDVRAMIGSLRSS